MRQYISNINFGMLGTTNVSGMYENDPMELLEEIDVTVIII